MDLRVQEFNYGEREGVILVTSNHVRRPFRCDHGGVRDERHQIVSSLFVHYVAHQSPDQQRGDFQVPKCILKQ